MGKTAINGSGGKSAHDHTIETLLRDDTVADDDDDGRASIATADFLR